MQLVSLEISTAPGSESQSRGLGHVPGGWQNGRWPFSDMETLRKRRMQFRQIVYTRFHRRRAAALLHRP